MENNLPKADFDALKSLIRNKETIIQKTVKAILWFFLTDKIAFLK